MKFSHVSGAKLECEGCPADLHIELEGRLSKLGFSEVVEVPLEEAPAPAKKAAPKKRAAYKRK